MDNKPREVWPFIEWDGHEIHEHRFYGFGDAGGWYGPQEGFESQDKCLKYCNTCELDEGQISTDPKDLGGVMCCVLSGRQFIDRIYELCEDAHQFEDYGMWSV